MKDSRVRLIWIMLLLLAVAVASSGAWAGSPVSIWPTYHGDMFRAGVNSNAVDITNPASLDLIWVFPKATEDVTADDYKFVVDNLSDTLFISAGEWTEYKDEEAWGWTGANSAQETKPYSYLRAPAQSKKDADGNNTSVKARAEWSFPTDIPKGYYQVWVWVPPGPPVVVGESPSPAFNYTKKAIYTVTDAQGTSSIVFDQTRGGTWQLLSATPFDFTGSGVLKVSLTSTTNDTAAEIADQRLWVAADAIKFVAMTGKEIYASPVSAEMDFNHKWTDSSGTSREWSGRIPVVYVASVEQSLGKGTGETGAVWCINSITPDNQAWDTDDTHKELANLLGTHLWKYPRDFASMSQAEAESFLLEKNSGIEGPIEGGIYATPTLAHVGGNVDKFECIVPAMDRQVYSLDAETGKLLWKGPGVTLPEDKENKNFKTEPDDTGATLSLRNDAFGGQFRWAECTSNDPASEKLMSWDFSTYVSQAGQPNNDGWSYNVFVWIPVAKSGATEGGKWRANDANYTVYYGTNQASVVKVDQSLRANQGKWVKLGAFFNVTKVELSTKTEATDPIDPEKPAGAKQPADKYCVVADAAMIVPEAIGPFGYSSVATDVALHVDEYPTANGPQKATKAYACTATEGRLIAFDLLASKPTNDPIGKVDWIFPEIRTKSQITDPNSNAGGDQPSLGEVGASPTYFDYNGTARLYVPTLSGTIYSLNAQTGSKLATFSTPASDIQSGFTASVTVGKSGATGTGEPVVFAASTAGVLFALDPVSLAQQAASSVVGAYRFSTPSVVRTATNNLLWAASTDSKVRAYDMSDGNFMQSANLTSVPKVGAQVQGAPAFDGAVASKNKNVTMYVGDMDGYLSWFDAETGTSNWTYNFDDPTGSIQEGDPNYVAPTNYTSWQCDGALFASPNVTHFEGNNISMTYIYVAGADGRLYAFSNDGGAWGGMFAQPFRPRLRTPHRHGSSPVGDDSREPPNITVQAEIINQGFYDKSMVTDPQPIDPTSGKLLDTSVSGSAWTADWIVGPTMKKPTKTFTSGTSAADRAKRNQEIEDYLLEESRKRREATFFNSVTGSNEDAVFPKLADRTAHKPIYLEWGETLNIVLWNLPELEFLSGGNAQSAASSFVFKFQNTSEGESSGNLIRQAGRVTLKEYTVLSNTPAKNAKGAVIPNAYEPLKHGWGHEVKRCYALAQITLDHKKNPPFSPGPGWNLVVEFPRKVNSSTNSPTTQITVPIAQLSNASPPIPQIKSTRDKISETVEEPLGINNPLSIRDDLDVIQGSGLYTGIGWPAEGPNQFMVDNGARNMRAKADRHYNGNASGTGASDYTRMAFLPFVDYQFVNHGTASRQASIGIMDTSATGTRIQNILAPVPGATNGEIVYTKIENFRIETGDLHWHGGPQAINQSGGIWFPWEYGPGSIDYPNIAPSRQEYRQASTDGLPTSQPTALPPVEGGIAKGATIGAYNSSIMRPDTVFTSVDVPRFQPALINPNLSNTNLGPLPDDFGAYGYSRTMTAFIDSIPDGVCNFGDTVLGKPTVNQECYRRFKVGVMVPPDPKIEVEEQLVDIGIAPHGLGEYMSGPWEFDANNPLPSIRQWFKPITVKNAGNVNLKNMKIGRYVKLYNSTTNDVDPIPQNEITSSLDDMTATSPQNPILRMLKVAPFSSLNYGLGYTATKARVGDPDPTEMSVPDKRKWDMDFDGAKTRSKQLYADFVGLINNLPEVTSKLSPALDSPMPIFVSTRIPLSQPVGVYQSFDNQSFGGNKSSSYVPVFSDSNNNGFLDLNMANGNLNTENLLGNEYYSQTSFQLKATVKETQLTGGVTSSSLAHIDGDNAPKFGDATPAAFRDPADGNVLLVWSSQRAVSPTALGSLDPKVKANAPWLLSHGNLTWNGKWVPDNPAQWWKLDQWSSNAGDPKPYLPYFAGTSTPEWPSSLLGEYAKWEVLPWSNGVASVRHTSPVFAQYTVKNSDNTEKQKAILAWVGTADVKDPNTQKVGQEHRIFYTSADGGNITSKDQLILSIDHDPAMVKRSPSIVMDGSRLWAFWQGGSDGRWSLYCSANDNPFDTSAGFWTPDTKLLLPDCLTTVSAPNALLRNTPSGKFFDVVYAGATKLSGSSDIMMTRYSAVVDANDASNPDLPSNKAHPMPRVFSEKLTRDSKYGFYSSKHLAWIRAAVGASPAADKWGEYEVSDSNADLPYIRVMLPVGYKYKDSTGTEVTLSELTAISATDGSVWTYTKDSQGGYSWENSVAGSGITPVVDEGSGTYTYNYKSSSLAKQILGQTIVDFSAGIVRVTNPLSELKVDDAFVSANVYADYTPRTWRFTQDTATDDSPRAFIETTRSMAKPDGTPLSVDRLWTFWRKAASGAQSSTIYYATYRMGVKLDKDLFRQNSKTMLPDTKYWITGVEGAAAWEIDGSGSKVYLRQSDEAYRTLAKATGSAPASFVIHYAWKDSKGEVKDDTMVAQDVFWIPELPEQSLLGFTADGNINEGSIYAFADPIPGTLSPGKSSKIWLFWTSTRGGTSDLFWETISPELSAK